MAYIYAYLNMEVFLALHFFSGQENVNAKNGGGLAYL